MVSKSDIKRAQAIEDTVYRYLLGIARYVAIAALRDHSQRMSSLRGGGGLSPQ